MGQPNISQDTAAGPTEQLAAFQIVLPVFLSTPDVAASQPPQSYRGSDLYIVFISDTVLSFIPYSINRIFTILYLCLVP